MENVEMTVQGDKLTIVVDLSKKGVPSSTGKTMLIASTRGAAAVPGAKRAGVKVALNVTVPS